MAGKYLIGIDIGTQGTKTTLFSVEGRRIADAFEQSNLIKPSPGVVEQDPGEIYGSVLNTIKEVMLKSGAAPGDVLGIGMDGQMAGILGIDDEWNAVTPYDSWLDTRCEKYIRMIKDEAEDLVVSITGCPVTYAHGPKILWWKHERPETYKKISKFVIPTAYVAGRLTGLKASQAYIDNTHLHFSGFGDVSGNCWSEELLDLFDVEKDKLPDITEPTKVVRLTAEAASQCGLIKGIPMAYINGGGLCIRWFRENLTGRDKPMSYRELDEEAAGLLKRMHGGAINISRAGFELDYYQKEIKNQAEKRKIARLAMDFVEDGDIIAVDTGTTALEFARLLPARKRLTVVTNDLIIAGYLEEHSDANVILTGGAVRRNFHCMVGPIAVRSMQGLSVDKAFIATNGITPKTGLTPRT